MATTVALEDATVEWLATYLSRFGGLAVHVPRDIETAQKYFIAEATAISVSRFVARPQHSYLQIETTDELGPDVLGTLLGITIACEGRSYRFDSISAEIESSFPEGEAPDRWLEIRFKPE